MTDQKQQPHSTSSTNDEIGVEHIAKLIHRSRVALGMADRPLTADSATKQAREYLSVLDPTITLNQLEDCYIRAMRAKKDTFQLSAIELNLAWRTMVDEVGTVEITKCIGCEAEESTGKPCPFHKKTEETKSDER